MKNNVECREMSLTGLLATISIARTGFMASGTEMMNKQEIIPGIIK
jgi:hypothetical protein